MVYVCARGRDPAVRWGQKDSAFLGLIFIQDMSKFQLDEILVS